MNNLTDWIKTDLYPTLFENMDKLLPELQLKRASAGNKWMSSLNRNGSTPKNKRADKTVITNKAPGVILENGDGGSIGIIDYIKERDRVEFIPALKTIADIVGLKLPSSKEFNSDEYKKYKDRLTLLEDSNSYFIYCLENATGSDKVKDYLKDRGYSPEDIKVMELGFIPSQEKVNKFLLGKGYSSELIAEVLKLNVAIGDTHKLTLPFRSGGSLKGFVVRTLEKEQTNKYINSTGLARSETFFNLKPIRGDKDLLIVEGYLDALISEAKGIDNVVALGGVNISEAQIKNAISKGARSFTLCLDKDKAGVEATNKAIDSILSEGVNKVYIVTLPEIADSKTDPDQLIKDKGVEYFKELIAQALPYWKYKLQNILTKYSEIETERGEFTERDIDNLLDEVVVTGSSIKDVIDRERYKKLFTELPQVKDLGVTAESLSIASDRIIISKDREIQAREFNSLLSEATKLKESGEIDKALELLNKKVKDVKIIGAKGLLPPPISFTTLLDEIATLPPAYKTGYSSLDSFVGFTPGAISLIAGRPSHGKTTFMFNLLLEMSKLYKDESFYFFTYEEPLKNISIKLLNRLINTDLSGYYRDVKNLSTPTNYEFIKSYIKARRTDISQIEEGKSQLQELIDSQRIRIIDRNYSVEELSSLIAYLNKRERIGGLFIDYIQRMKTDAKTQDMRTKIAHISDSVLQIAKDSGLPIILGAQLNRATQDSKGGKPKLENLKEAGNLEEDANTVLSVYNESREKEETSEGGSYKGLREVDLEIKALKNREGEVNQTALLTFDRWTGVIKNSSSNNTYFK